MQDLTDKLDKMLDTTIESAKQAIEWSAKYGNALGALESVILPILMCETDSEALHEAEEVVKRIRQNNPSLWKALGGLFEEKYQQHFAHKRAE